MRRVLLITVRFSQGRYHGDDSNPSPARLFQALIAGAGLSGPLPERAIEGLTWLEQLEPPILATPYLTEGRAYQVWVPNNDLDAKGGDPERVGEIRTSKQIKPRLFDASVPFYFAWTFDQRDETKAQTICELAENIYQLGCGVDMAWAYGEILEESDWIDRSSVYPGLVFRPTPLLTGGVKRMCPTPGSLASLQQRYHSLSRRFLHTGKQSKTVQVFRRRPKSIFESVTYDGTLTRFLFELSGDPGNESLPFALEDSYQVVKTVRDAALKRLTQGSSDEEWNNRVTGVLVGRKPNGDNPCPPDQRIRMVPIPSIGHGQVDRKIRRLLVEVPVASGIPAEDVEWAFAGAEMRLSESSVVRRLVRTKDEKMLSHFGIEEGFRVWRSVTPVVLPKVGRTKKSTGKERASTELVMQEAVRNSLRHAGITAGVDFVKVQKEPWEKNGRIASDFAAGSRFEAARLWHVALHFRKPQRGMVVLGNGRYMGLGVMAPAKTLSFPPVHCLGVSSGLTGKGSPLYLARAFRRALISRLQRIVGEGAPLPPYFTGHRSDGRCVEDQPHLAVHYDPAGSRFLLFTPDDPTEKERGNLNRRKLVGEALEGFHHLKAGQAGLLQLVSTPIKESDPVLSNSRTWLSRTPYRVNRHRKMGEAAEAIAVDVKDECRRRGLPEPTVSVTEIKNRPGDGLEATVKLQFKTAVAGPILLGKTRFLGGGLFGAK